MTLWIALLGTALTAISALVGVIITARQSRAAAHITASASRELARTAPYDKLADRVSKLEPRVDQLEAEQAVDRGYIRMLLGWVRMHAPDLSPPDPPSWYKDGYDPPPAGNGADTAPRRHT